MADQRIPDNELPVKDLIDTVKGANGLSGHISQTADKVVWGLGETGHETLIGITTCTGNKYIFPIGKVFIKIDPGFYVSDKGDRFHKVHIEFLDRSQCYDLAVSSLPPKEYLERLDFDPEWIKD